MAQLLVRKVAPEVIRALKQRAMEHGVSAEEEHRRILCENLEETGPKTFKEHLLSMENTVDDFELPKRGKSNRRIPSF